MITGDRPVWKENELLLLKCLVEQNNMKIAIINNQRKIINSRRIMMIVEVARLLGNIQQINMKTIGIKIMIIEEFIRRIIDKIPTKYMKIILRIEIGGKPISQINVNQVSIEIFKAGKQKRILEKAAIIMTEPEDLLEGKPNIF